MKPITEQMLRARIQAHAADAARSLAVHHAHAGACQELEALLADLLKEPEPDKPAATAPGYVEK